MQILESRYYYIAKLYYRISSKAPGRLENIFKNCMGAY